MRDDVIYQKEIQDWKKNVDFYKREIGSPFFQELTKAKISCYGIDMFSDKTVVDLGGANGYFLSRIKESCDFLSVTMDFIYDMLKVGKEMFNDKNNIFINASVDNIPIKSSSADIVVFNGALHHFKASGILDLSVEEADRILKKGGKVCIYDRNGSFVSRCLHGTAVTLRNLLKKVAKDLSTSASSTEPDFNDDDLKLFLDKGYIIKKRTFVSTAPFFLLLISCNFIEYTAGYNFAQILRKLFIIIAKLFERFLAFKWFSIEQCLVLEKTNSN